MHDTLPYFSSMYTGRTLVPLIKYVSCELAEEDQSVHQTHAHSDE